MWIRRRTSIRCSKFWAVAALCLFCACAAAEDDGPLIARFLDVGQADAAFITCGGQTLMIDGGNAADSDLIYSFLRNTAGVEHIDYMIATHPHEDHVGGLAAALNACTVGRIYSPVDVWDTRAFEAFARYARAQGAELVRPEDGETFTLGGAEVRILSGGGGFDDANEMSIVARIDYGEASLLFTGDAGWDAEHKLVDSGAPLAANVLKVGHHGSGTSTCYVFLREVLPAYAIISCGEGNPYGHPAEEVLSRLRDAGAIVIRTDEAGDVTVRCARDGRIWVWTQRGIK